jgi:hypothetical protein
MAKTVREKVVLAIFPAVIIVIAYVWMSARPGAQALQAAEIELQQAKDSPSPMRKINELARESDRIADEIEVKKRELDRLAVASAGSSIGSRSDRNKALQRLTSVLSANNLMLLDSTRLDENPLASAELQTLEKDISAARDQKSQYWRITVAGSFSAMLNVLNGISKGDDMIVPVSIDMETPDAAENFRAWTLTVWL